MLSVEHARAAQEFLAVRYFLALLLPLLLLHLLCRGEMTPVQSPLVSQHRVGLAAEVLCVV
jgi:hypothetical protein